MSGVDVLAVMYAEIANAESLAVSDAYQAERLPKLREARAAVAELVDKVDSALALGWSDTAARELRAALARCGGAK